MAAESRQSLYRYGAVEIRIVDGSITELADHHDAIVSSDNNYLSHGGGVSRAIWKSAGPKLVAHIQATPVLRLGDVFVSPAGQLAADYILHAITIDFDENRRLGPVEARNLYLAVLDRAAREGCRTLALPLLGAHAGRVGSANSSEMAARAAEAFVLASRDIDRITITARDREYGLCCAAFDRRFRVRPTLEVLLAAAAQEASGALQAKLKSMPGVSSGGEALRARVVSAAGLFRLALEFAAATAVGLGLENGPGGKDASEYDGAAGLEVVRHVARSRGRSWDSEDEEACDAASATASLVAGQPSSSQAELRALFLGTDRVLRASVADLPSAETTPEPSRTSESFRRNERPASTDGERPHHVAVEAAVPEPRSGTRHVRSLHALLLTALDKAARAGLLRRLHSMGYFGDEDRCLLEYCVRHDPIDVLKENLTWTMLAQEIHRRAKPEPEAAFDHGSLARMLLRDLGFPLGCEPRGLTSAIRTLERLDRAVHIAGAEELNGIVTQAGGELEHITLVLVRFICRAAFDRSPERFLRERGALDPDYDLERTGLGKRIELLQAVAHHLDTSAEIAFVAFRKETGEGGLVPPRAHDLAPLRNRFAHAGRSEDVGVPLEARADATRFFALALAFLRHFQEVRTFPLVIRIDRISFDRWGRRLVRATGESGQVEVLFTNVELRPGEIYYMLPRTNPIRVDPLLVPAGETG